MSLNAMVIFYGDYSTPLRYVQYSTYAALMREGWLTINYVDFNESFFVHGTRKFVCTLSYLWKSNPCRSYRVTGILYSGISIRVSPPHMIYHDYRYPYCTSFATLTASKAINQLVDASKD